MRRVPGGQRGWRAGALAGLAAALLLAACAGQEGPEPNPLGPDFPGSVDPEAVWSYLQGSEYRQYWLPESVVTAGVHAGREPHGPLIETFVNRAVDGGRPLGKEPLPPGSVIVLENHTTEPHVHAIDVMIKVEGHNPATNDWGFLRFNPGGGVKVSDQEARRQAREENRGCIHCHARTEETDFLFEPRLAR
ncbi:MAG: cytochrome P460 family protein [Thiohalospira sp.]